MVGPGGDDHVGGGHGRSSERRVALRLVRGGRREYAFGGDYREVIPPERLVNTFEFEGMPGHVLVETAVCASC